MFVGFIIIRQRAITSNMEDMIKKAMKELTKDWTEEDWCKMEEDSFRKSKIDEIIIKAIRGVDKLGWVQKINGEPFIHLADVEKIIFGLFDKDYGERINKWIKDSHKEKQ